MPKLSPKGRPHLLIQSEMREFDVLLTPVKTVDLRSAYDVPKEDYRGSHSPCKAMGDSLESPQKDLNPVEFRSGYRGVSWNRRMKAWLAFWSEGKNRRSKTFNAKVMGFEKARAAAIDFLKRKKQLLQQGDENVMDDDCCGNMEAFGMVDEEEFGESHSLADSTTTTSDSPNSTGGICSLCGSQQEGINASDCSCTAIRQRHGECSTVQ